MNEGHAATESDSTLDSYMRDVSRHALLSVHEERELGAQLIASRVEYWQAVLSYAPYTAAALEVVGPLEGVPEELYAEVGRAARAARDSNRKAAEERFVRAIGALARALAVADPECIRADRIAADLELLNAHRSEGLTMDVKPPRKQSRPFSDYLARVERAATALRWVRNRFAQANLRLVVRIAHRFQRSGLTLHDRVQEGNLGLMKAVDRFDPARGFRFSTYASWWIKHAIRRAVVNRGRTIRLPAHLQATAGKLMRTRLELRAELQREPSVEELARAVDMPVDKVEATLDASSQRAVSLDARFSDADDRSVADLLADDEAAGPDEHVSVMFDSARLRRELLGLSPMEQDILRQRFGLDGNDERTLTEIGGQYALSRERIRQLQQKALARLRSGMNVGPHAEHIDA